ncbi:MAG: hypothetical protein IJ523_01680 [Succinivibrionaceae bacterium]|nr:hypothetical protein [Succinivibrionaceae bacterium]
MSGGRFVEIFFAADRRVRADVPNGNLGRGFRIGIKDCGLTGWSEFRQGLLTEEHLLFFAAAKLLQKKDFVPREVFPAGRRLRDGLALSGAFGALAMGFL